MQSRFLPDQSELSLLLRLVLFSCQVAGFIALLASAFHALQGDERVALVAVIVALLALTVSQGLQIRSLNQRFAERFGGTEESKLAQHEERGAESAARDESSITYNLRKGTGDGDRGGIKTVSD